MGRLNIRRSLTVGILLAAVGVAVNTVNSNEPMKTLLVWTAVMSLAVLVLAVVLRRLARPS